MKTLSLILLALILSLAGLGFANAELNEALADNDHAPDCVAVSFDNSTEDVINGVTVTWDSAFLCADAADEGTYEFSVTVKRIDGDEDVTLESIVLTHTTPRARGQAPSAAIDPVEDLPLTLAPDEDGQFTVTGTYKLVWTDEGMKANLHFRLSGQGDVSREPFNLGINLVLRGEGAIEDADDRDGPPDWAPGPPPWAGLNDDDDDAAGPPDWAPGPPPWADNNDDDDDADGPPDWAPGPPPWVDNNDDDDDADGPPDWAPGPPPWAGPPQRR